MHRLAHQGSHRACSPRPWRAVPKVTGDYDLDATIMHRGNSDLPHRLAQHLKQQAGPAYSPRTNTNGYHGNHGDD